MGTQFEDLTPLIISLIIVFTLLTVAVAAYFLSSERTRSPVRQIALWSAAGVSTVVAFFVSAAFGVPVLEDLHDPHVNFREALIGAAIVWAVCIGAWVVAIRSVVSAVRAEPPRVDRD